MEQIEGGPVEQPLGKPMAFGGATPPVHTELRGRRVALRPYHPAGDAGPLYAASHAPTGDPRIWTYLYDGPYPDLESFRESLEQQAARHDYVFFTVAGAGDNRPLGIVSYLSIVPEHGVAGAVGAGALATCAVAARPSRRWRAPAT